MRSHIYTSTILFVILFTIAPLPRIKNSEAATKTSFGYAAWLPFWKKTSGVLEMNQHWHVFAEISPFSYEVRSDGTLVDKLKLNGGFWPGWLAAMEALHVKVIPAVAWFDGNGIHKLFSNKKIRNTHIAEIVTMVAENGFAGADIDFENKKAETKKYFSLFIKSLGNKLHAQKKILACSIEPRTPLSSRFKKPPAGIEYANDYRVLNAYCDEVRLMAFDQGNVDLLLNQEKGSGGNLYMPVADKDWVMKVIKETAKTIKPSKIVLGVPTYGYEYAVTQDKNGTSYRRVRSVTYETAAALAKSLGISPVRNSAGELSFTYVTTTIVTASSTATSTPTPPQVVSTTRFVSFSDAFAIAEKIDLAKKYKLRGAIFFKLDGETDPGLWEKIK